MSEPKDPFTHNLAEFSKPGAGKLENDSSKFNNAHFNEIVNNLKKDYPEIAKALELLNDNEKLSLDKDINILGEDWGVFNLVDESNQEKIIAILNLFKELDKDYQHLTNYKEKEEALKKRKLIAKNLIDTLSG